MEDMCQLTEALSEDKYLGSIEKIGKVIQTYSSNPGFDVISLFELSLFCFLTGNADMHLKNFSLLTTKENDTGLAPACNLVASLLVFPKVKEEMALSVNSKKKNLMKSDWDALAEKLKINPKTLVNTYKRFQKNIPQMLEFIDISFLHEELKNNYKDLIKHRAYVLFEIQDADLTNKSIGENIEKYDSEVIKEMIDEVLEKNDTDPFSRQLSLF
jgi:serine/threonine-protein kinase HipA